MTISSAQLDCLTISSDIGIIAQDVDTILSDTITLTSGTGSSYYYTGGGSGGTGTISITGGGSGSTSYTIGGAGSGGFAGITAQDISTFNWNLNEEFVNCLPDLERVKKMCEEYPGLKIAYEKFVTTYKLVRDDYDTPKDKRPKP
jgi:hypothetical protein